MKLIATAALLFPLYAAAQTIKACDGKAQPCIDDAMTKANCAIGDIACGCERQSEIQNYAYDCVLSNCGMVEGWNVAKEAGALCEKH